MKEEYILYINFHWGEYHFAITRDKLVHCDSVHNLAYFANVIQKLSQVKELIHNEKYTCICKSSENLLYTSESHFTTILTEIKNILLYLVLSFKILLMYKDLIYNSPAPTVVFSGRSVDLSFWSVVPSTDIRRFVASKSASGVLAVLPFCLARWCCPLCVILSGNKLSRSVASFSKESFGRVWVEQVP